jgi:hypothetical protein
MVETPGPDASRASEAALEFRGTERFSVEQRLGVGAMGVVYRVRDHVRGAPVALKLLRRVDPMGIYRFKHEFRALADVAHPNLVALYELVAAGDRWFFTMEIVDGVSFVAYVRDGPGARTPRPTPDTTTGEIDPVGETAAVGSSADTTGEWAGQHSRVHPPLTRLDQYTRLRTGLRQLAEGAMALHRAGHLHRDIKPSNVLVTAAERVVLLDFGVVTELAQHTIDDGDAKLVGTPAFMAPEQAAGGALTAASDWYAVGVMLYEALTGRRPFDGDARRVLAAKQREDPPSPYAHAPEAPRDLAELGQGLLARDPEQRMTGADVLVLQMVGGASEAGYALALAGPATSGAPLLVGRRCHLETLQRAYHDVETGEPRTVLVSGRSGTGKSVLCHHFLDALRHDTHAVVLSGRCYEQESVPYKALDAVIDSLSHALIELPARDAREIVPSTVQALARLFPVLRRVDAVLEAPTHVLQTPDAHELRRRGFTALRRLFNRLAERRPLVLCIDDLQWADTDSAALLAEVLRPPEPPPMLFICGFRTEDLATSEFLRAVQSFLPAAGEASDASHSHIIRLSVDQLSHDDSHELAAALLARAEMGADPDRAVRAEGIARESGGNPFFIHELVRYVAGAGAAGRRPALDRDVRLEEVLQARLRELPADARRLLELVAVAGRPIPQDFILRAAQLGEEGRPALAILRAAHLARTGGARRSDEIEPYHDRIREVIVDGLAVEVRRDHNRRLAAALEASGTADPETLAVHFERAGAGVEAGGYYQTAAARASDALAFDRAAALVRRALDLPLGEATSRNDLQVRLGSALINGGRGAEAAEAFLAACHGASLETRRDCQRHAALQLLITGHIERGLGTLELLLAEAGARLPATPLRA